MSGSTTGADGLPVTESIGQLLARLRAERGLDVGKAAQELHCDRAIIDSLEADRYADIGAAVYARGHLRRYADFLGAPTAQLLARWSAEQGGGQPLPDLTRAPQAPRPIDTRRWGRLLAAVAGALAIGIAAWWILQGAGARPAPAKASPAADAAPVVVQPPAASPAVDRSSAPPAQDAPSPSIKPVSAAPEPGDVSVAFTTPEDCWAEVIDARGVRRLYQTIRPGERVTAAGPPPLRVTLGRGDVTRVEIDGRAAILPQDAIRDAVARFEVAASGALRALPPVPSPQASSPQASSPQAPPTSGPVAAAPTTEPP